MKWFGREPAVLITQVNAAIVAVLLLSKLSEPAQAAIGGATTAIGGLIIAMVVRRERALPALVAVARTLVTLAVVLGVKWDPAYQIMLIAAFETVAGIFIRDRVVAPVDETGARRQVAAPPLGV
jgi:membrane associated rhomboid family serine protease